MDRLNLIDFAMSFLLVQLFFKKKEGKRDDCIYLLEVQKAALGNPREACLSGLSSAGGRGMREGSILLCSRSGMG